jgi:hypothetical protein
LARKSSAANAGERRADPDRRHASQRRRSSSTT